MPIIDVYIVPEMHDVKDVLKANASLDVSYNQIYDIDQVIVELILISIYFVVYN